MEDAGETAGDEGAFIYTARFSIALNRINIITVGRGVDVG